MRRWNGRAAVFVLVHHGKGIVMGRIKVVANFIHIFVHKMAHIVADLHVSSLATTYPIIKSNPKYRMSQTKA